MYSDQMDRADLHRLADDGCPHVAAWEPRDTDLSQGTIVTGKDDRGDR